MLMEADQLSYAPTDWLHSETNHKQTSKYSMLKIRISETITNLLAICYQHVPRSLKATFQWGRVIISQSLASGIEGHTVLLLIMSKGSFLFRKQKSTAKHTASIHKIIYGTDN